MQSLVRGSKANGPTSTISVAAPRRMIFEDERVAYEGL
jgi:hypothetical protein